MGKPSYYCKHGAGYVCVSCLIEERDDAITSRNAWEDNWEQTKTERDKAIKERDDAKEIAEYYSSLMHLAHKNSEYWKRECEIARTWARKMMAERDEWKKRYDGLRVHQLETTLRTKDGWEFFVDDGVLWGRKK
jgi:hypothetical protein